jgi:spore coat protein A
MTRRTILKQSMLVAGTASATHLDGISDGEICRTLNLSAREASFAALAKSSEIRSVGHLLAKYVDPLPVPPVIAAGGKAGQALHIDMREVRQKIHRDLPPSKIWGYNGLWPGPTIEARRGQPIEVTWTNRLPVGHLLPIDSTIHGAEDSLPAVRTVVHLHGAAVEPDSDGCPEAWFTADGKTGPKFVSATSIYPNDQPATALWYHDHCLGITRLNIYAGLAGLYIIRDDLEDALNLPSGGFEIPLILQDRQFLADGTLHYPRAVDGTHPIWIQEFFGDVNCVNGKATPFLEVEPRKYRFRLLNASNSRFYHLRLFAADSSGKVADDGADAPAFSQIGTDGGLLPRPLRLHYLLIAPGERFDVVIDFSAYRNNHFALLNDAPAPYTMGGGMAAREVMLFRVTKPLSGLDGSQLPAQLAPFEPLDPALAERERFLAVTEVERPSDGYVVIGLLGNARWHEPITEDPKQGATEIWSFANTTGDVHPLHIHLVRFQVLNRQAFDVPAYLQTGKIVFVGRPMAPESNERPAAKDTVKAYPGYVTRVIQRFDLPGGLTVPPGKEYLYVWHCHILEHEDNEMMRPYKLIG